MKTVKPLTSADLRHQITITATVEVDNGNGGYANTIQTVAQPWAEVFAIEGYEATLNQVLQGIATYRIRIRHRDGINAGQQVRFGSIDLNIKSSIDPDGRREQLVIVASTDGTLAG